MIAASPPKKQPIPPMVTYLTVPDVNRALADLAARLVAAETRLAILEAEVNRRASEF